MRCCVLIFESSKRHGKSKHTVDQLFKFFDRVVAATSLTFFFLFQGMEESGFVNQWHKSSMDELGTLPLAAAFGENLQHSYAQANFDQKASSNHSHNAIFGYVKQLKTDGWSSYQTSDHLPNSQNIAYPTASVSASNCTNQMDFTRPKEEVVCPQSISNLPSDMLISQGLFRHQGHITKSYHGTKRTATNSRFSQAQDHILAERKRREKLSQRFIALSAIVPGLKKVMDLCHVG